MKKFPIYYLLAFLGLSKKQSKETISMFFLVLMIVIISLLGHFVKYIILIFSEFNKIMFSSVVINTIVVCLVGWIIYYLFFPVFEFFYYKSKTFLAIKQSIDKNVDKCNLLNMHIDYLKHSNIKIKSTDFGISDYKDNSIYKYNRPELKKLKYDNNVYDCSLSICKSAQQQPFKYLCKYFDFDISETFLTNVENTLNNFLAAEQGKVLLIQERNRILDIIKEKIPYILIKYRLDKLVTKLGFDFVDFNKPYFPKYTFRYISPGGNSSMVCDIFLDVCNLEKLIQYVAKCIDYKNSIQGQRVLMTHSLREKIKKRDSYTCQHCGLSINDEPNLLLEIDHIIPVSKGGKTEENNLQTLCWKCNRHKSNKI